MFEEPEHMSGARCYELVSRIAEGLPVDDTTELGQAEIRRLRRTGLIERKSGLTPDYDYEVTPTGAEYVAQVQAYRARQVVE